MNDKQRKQMIARRGKLNGRLSQASVSMGLFLIGASFLAVIHGESGSDIIATLVIFAVGAAYIYKGRCTPKKKKRSSEYYLSKAKNKNAR